MVVQRLPSLVSCAVYSAVLLAAALGPALRTARTQPLGTGVISGTLVDGDSGDTIRKAVVTLTQQGTPRRWATVRTDGSGRFQFEGLPAGKYDLRATKADAGTAIYGANHARELGDIISLGDGEKRGGLTLRFLHSGSISGRVYDSDGDPLADVMVNLLRRGRNLGAPVLTNYRSSTTDDRGEFRILNIDPGQYYLRASAGSGRWIGPPAEAGQSILVEQYYGGARDPKDASPIHLSGGETLAGLDFHLASEPAASIRGRVIGIPQEPVAPQTQAEHPGKFGIISRTFITSTDGFIGGENGPEVSVTISPAGDFGQQGWTTGTVTQGPEHRFQMGNFAAGRYRVEATYQTGSKTYGASQIFDLNANSGEIVLTLAPAIDLAGTIRVEGHAAPAEQKAVRLNGIGAPGLGGDGFGVHLTRPGNGQNTISAEMGAGGRFSFPQVVPGEWQLAVTPVPPGFLRSAQFGDKDVRFTTFEVEGKSDTALNIVVSMNTAVVEGEIDAGSSDSKRAGIVIAPLGTYHNLARFYYGTTTDDKGKFQLGGIAPGKYKIFAIEKMAPASFRTPEAADQLVEFGEVINLAEGATLETHPKLIPAERASRALQ
jgi:protocatechuate 3,4-dioxygenase beta subunit